MVVTFCTTTKKHSEKTSKEIWEKKQWYKICITKFYILPEKNLTPI